MKNKVVLLVIIIFTTICARGQKESCSRISQFGEKEICLPKIDGYKESYLHPKVKYVADNTEIPVNQVLGYYLDDEVYKQSENIENLALNDYFKIYVTKQLSDYHADRNILNQVKETLSSNFFVKNWDEVKETISETGLDVDISTPTIVKSYELNDKSFTYVMIAKYSIGETESFTMAMTMNGLLLNERLIWMAYYLRYNDESTIPLLQENSNRILKTIQENNDL